MVHNIPTYGSQNRGEEMQRKMSMSSINNNNNDQIISLSVSTAPTLTASESNISTESSGLVGSDDYNNSKQLRRYESSFSFSSFYEQSKSPFQIISSIYNDITLSLIRDLIVSILCFLFGVHGPKVYILPLIGGLTIRPIPYQTTSAGDVLIDLTLANDIIPKSDVTFPSEKLWLISLWLPLLMLNIIGAIFPIEMIQSTTTTMSSSNNNPLQNMHAGTCTILVAIGISELVTQTFKFYVGRLRPNFYAMCGFNSETLSCTASEEMQMEARMSFPSGHSSISFCGLICVVLFLLGRVGLGRPNIGSRIASLRGKISIVMSFTPLLIAFWCATSRLVDNWHHPSDIIAGSILGTVCGVISYHIWYPHILSTHAGIPLSVIRAEEDGSNNKVGHDYCLVEKSISLPVYNNS